MRGVSGHFIAPAAFTPLPTKYGNTYGSLKMHMFIFCTTLIIMNI